MTPNSNSNAPKCSFCGSRLIFVSQKIEKGDGLFPITSIIYRCSDPSCQKEIDKRTVERMKLQRKQKRDKLKRKEAQSAAKIAS